VSIAQRVRGWLPVIVAVGLLAAGAVIAVPLGGWDTVQLRSANLPEQPIGQPYPGGRMSTAIDDVYLTDTHPDGFSEPEPGTTFLVVQVTAENLTREPQYLVGSGFYPFTIPGVIELDDVLGPADYSEVLVRDGSFGARLNPGVPDTVFVTFVVDDDLFADGDEIRVGLTDGRAEQADIYDGTRWVNEHVAVEVPLVIRDER
jgi:hypothetical protein